jgi:hypothetical protein
MLVAHRVIPLPLELALGGRSDAVDPLVRVECTAGELCVGLRDIIHISWRSFLKKEDSE